ncbi:hypothetical protein BCR35DRAFT_309958 [Leucosporidium creatinivorum]|uniref:Proteophosphoglycan ppg4 n=1 Tax=Leucosporidium creatinivorum TaxID=106004 RepID=A0A1Y2D8Y1_9BASI|nr:hypothetical protein BCR35DRAFT_309958 [Leucosporidium creatinivorum]
MEWLASPSASAVAVTATTRAIAATGFLELELPYHLSLLPSLFRMVALVFFAPVVILAAGDCLGWAFFKLILRPLGYSSVIRFKDPEPPTTRLSPPSASTSRRARSSSQRAGKRHNEEGIQRTTSLPARPRRHSTSSTIHASSALGLGGLDSTSSSTTHSPPNGEARSASPSSFTTTSSSSSSSPILMTYSSSSSLSSSPSNSPKSIDLALPDSHPHSHGRPRSASTGSSSSSILPGLRRHRAASVGVEGPLFGTQEDGEEPGLMSPARSDCEELPPMTESESEGEGGNTTLTSTVRRRRGRQAGVPRRGPKFDFTVME